MSGVSQAEGSVSGKMGGLQLQIHTSVGHGRESAKPKPLGGVLPVDAVGGGRGECGDLVGVHPPVVVVNVDDPYPPAELVQSRGQT